MTVRPRSWPARLASIILLAVLPLTACGHAPADEGAADPPAPPPGFDPADAITVMSFNVRYGTADDGDDSWPHRRELVFDVIRRHDPDLLGLQEALRFQLDELGAALPRYAEIGVGRDDGAHDGEYAAILYRAARFDVGETGTFWFADTPEVPGSRTWESKHARITTWARLVDRRTGRAFTIWNVHLDHKSVISRVRSVEMLARRIAGRTDPHEPVIATGDFNDVEDSAPIRFLRGELVSAADPSTPAPAGLTLRLVDAFRVRHTEAGGDGTFHDFRGRRGGRRIDYVFVSPDVTVLDAAIARDHDDDGRYPSDHFPVTARVALPR